MDENNESYPLIEDESSINNRTEDESQGNPLCPMSFGVRSYLHHFYSSDIDHPDYIATINDEDSREERTPFDITFICKSFIWISINLVIVGIIVLLIGFVLPKRPIVIGYKENLEIIDKAAINYNNLLEKCRYIGLIIFSVGTSILFLSLIACSLIPIPEDVPSRCDDFMRGGSGGGTNITSTIANENLISPFDSSSAFQGGIPILHKISPVQPSW